MGNGAEYDILRQDAADVYRSGATRARLCGEPVQAVIVLDRDDDQFVITTTSLRSGHQRRHCLPSNATSLDRLVAYWAGEATALHARFPELDIDE